MILVIFVGALAVAIGSLRRGSLDELARTEFRWVPVLVAALVIQVGADLWNPPWLGDNGGLAVLLGTNAAVAAFLLRNWRLPGMPAAGAGMVLNVIVISANGAMPVSAEAARLAGMEGRFVDPGLKHEILGPGTVLPWLADVIPVPVVGTVISAGDVLLAVGIGWLIYRRMTETPAPERKARRAASD